MFAADIVVYGKAAVGSPRQDSERVRHPVAVYVIEPAVMLWGGMKSGATVCFLCHIISIGIKVVPRRYIRPLHCKGLFCIMGKFFELLHDTKSPPGRIALRRRGIMPLKRPAAGGESAFGRSSF